MPLYPAAIRRLGLDNADLLIANSQGYAKAAIANRTALHVCYCHAPLPFAWEPLEWQFPKDEIGHWRYRFIEKLAERFRRWDHMAAGQIDLFVASSESVRQKIRQLYGRPAKVIYPPVDTEYFTPAQPDRQGYFLMVGPLTRRKRFDIAIATFNSIKDKLVVVGDGPDFLRLVNSSPGNVSFTGHISDEKLREHYRNCQAIIVTSDSDFSMAALEAAACGKPVIAFAGAGMQEMFPSKSDAGSANYILSDYGLLVKERPAIGLKEAIKAIRAESFDSAEIRRNTLRFSKQVFFGQMRDFLTEAVGVFRQEGRVKLEERLIE